MDKKVKKENNVKRLFNVKKGNPKIQKHGDDHSELSWMKFCYTMKLIGVPLLEDIWMAMIVGS